MNTPALPRIEYALALIEWRFIEAGTIIDDDISEDLLINADNGTVYDFNDDDNDPCWTPLAHNEDTEWEESEHPFRVRIDFDLYACRYRCISEWHDDPWNSMIDHEADNYGTADTFTHVGRELLADIQADRQGREDPQPPTMPHGGFVSIWKTVQPIPDPHDIEGGDVTIEYHGIVQLNDLIPYMIQKRTQEQS